MTGKIGGGSRGGREGKEALLPHYGSQMKEKEWEFVNFHEKEMEGKMDYFYYFKR